MKVKTLLLILLGIPIGCFAHEKKDQVKNKKGTFSFYWGYNRSFFSKTNIHFNGPNYDFTLYDVKGTDRPTPLSLTYINPTTISIPQYNYRLSYFINDRFAISLGMDHMKYVMKQNQLARISGIITPEASQTFQGSYLNDEIKITPDLLQFEHTDGFNLVTVDGEYLLPLPVKMGKNFKSYFNMGIGGIWIVTKTNVKVMGEGLDNDFHVAGFSMAAKMGPRIEYKNKLFILGEIKGGYATLPSVLIKNEAPNIGDHNLSYLQYYFALGINFSLKKKH